MVGTESLGCSRSAPKPQAESWNAESFESIHNHSAFARIVQSPAEVRENRPRTGHGTNFPVLVAASPS